MLRFIVKLAHIRMLDAIFAAHLFNDQLAVPANQDGFGTHFFGSFQAANERAIFGNIVGGPPDAPPEGKNRRPMGGTKHHADPRRPRVPATAAVKLNGNRLVHPRTVTNDSARSTGSKRSKA